MTQRLSFLASFDIVILNTGPFPERERECGRLYSGFDDQAYR